MNDYPNACPSREAASDAALARSLEYWRDTLRENERLRHALRLILALNGKHDLLDAQTIARDELNLKSHQQ